MLAPWHRRLWCRVYGTQVRIFVPWDPKEKLVPRAVSYNIRLLIPCPDKKGLIAAIASFIAMYDGNIFSADQ